MRNLATTDQETGPWGSRKIDLSYPHLNRLHLADFTWTDAVDGRPHLNKSHPSRFHLSKRPHPSRPHPNSWADPTYADLTWADPTWADPAWADYTSTAHTWAGLTCVGMGLVTSVMGPMILRQSLVSWNPVVASMGELFCSGMFQ